MNNLVAKRVVLIVSMVCSFGYICAAAHSSRTMREENLERIPPAPPFGENKAEAAPRTETKSAEQVASEIKKSEEESARQGVLSQNLLHDVIMIFNDEPEEWLGAVTSDFLLALHQKTVPILVTGAVVAHFLDWVNSEKGLSEALPISSTQKKAFMPSDEDWHIYASSSSSFYLFIPIAYQKAKLSLAQDTKTKEHVVQEAREHIAQIELHDQKLLKAKNKVETGKGSFNVSSKKYTDKELLLGFTTRDDEETDIKKIKVNELAHLAYSQENNPVQSDKIKFFLVPSGYWNIVIVGHGILRATAKNFAKPLSIESLENNMLAGLEFKAFKALLHFMDENLNVNMLYYSTCFGGDVHLIFPYTTNLLNEKGAFISSLTRQGELRNKFTIVSGAVTNAISSNNVRCVVDAVITDETLKKGCADYKEFFDRIHYACSVGQLPKRFTDEELLSILQAITPRYFEKREYARDSFLIANTPFVKGPQSMQFRPLPLSKKQHLITAVNAQQHARENKPFVFKDAEAVLISASEIAVPLSLEVSSEGLAPALVSLIPGFSALIKFESLTTTSTFSEFFIQSMGSIGALDKYFYFKELILINDQYGPHAGLGEKVRLTDVLVYLNDDALYVFWAHSNPESTTRTIYTAHATLIDKKSKGPLEFNAMAIEERNQFKTLVTDNHFLNAFVNYFGFPITYKHRVEVKSKLPGEPLMLLSGDEIKYLQTLAARGGEDVGDKESVAGENKLSEQEIQEKKTFKQEAEKRDVSLTREERALKKRKREEEELERKKEKLGKEKEELAELEEKMKQYLEKKQGELLEKRKKELLAYSDEVRKDIEDLMKSTLANTRLAREHVMRHVPTYDLQESFENLPTQDEIEKIYEDYTTKLDEWYSGLNARFSSVTTMAELNAIHANEEEEVILKEFNEKMWVLKDRIKDIRVLTEDR